MELVVALALGLGLGAITGMPLGVINVAIVDATLAGHRRHALGLGLGGALADAAHALLAVAGIARLLIARPAWSRALAIVAAATIVAYAVLAWRTRREPDARLARASSLASGVASGIALTLPNLGALAAWAAVAAMLWPRASVAEAAVFAAGVGAGSAAWFALLARLVARVDPSHRALRVVPRIALVLFVAIAIAGVARVI